MDTTHRSLPRVLIANGPSGFANAGDVALFQAMLLQLELRWPQCHVTVLTSEPDRGARRWPRLRFLPLEDYRAWTAVRRLPGALRRFIPLPLRWRVEGLEIATSDAWILALIRRPWLLPLERRPYGQAFRRLTALIRESDLVLASGGGTDTDAFADESWARMCVLRLAQQLGAPTAMLSQGLGPMLSPRLRRLAGKTWPEVGLISLREKRRGPELLRELGVDPVRVTISFDDAVAVALPRRSDALGSCLGLNIRASSYAGVTGAHLRSVAEAITRFSNRQACHVLGFPISARPGEEDEATLRRCIPGLEVLASHSDGICDPDQVIAEVSRCRVVVTGSYHGAVFALAQGIPAIGLVASEYYRDKFLGLADAFGSGCEVVQLDGPRVSAELDSAMQRLWTRAPDLRGVLLAKCCRARGKNRSSL